MTGVIPDKGDEGEIGEIGENSSLRVTPTETTTYDVGGYDEATHSIEVSKRVTVVVLPSSKKNGAKPPMSDGPFMLLPTIPKMDEPVESNHLRGISLEVALPAQASAIDPGSLLACAVALGILIVLGLAIAAFLLGKQLADAIRYFADSVAGPTVFWDEPDGDETGVEPLNDSSTPASTTTGDGNDPLDESDRTS